MWAVRAAEAAYTLHDFHEIQDAAATEARIIERRVIVEWLRNLNVASFGDPSVVVDDLAARIERGEHRQIAQVKP